MNSQNKNSHTDKTSKYKFVMKEGDDFTCLKLLSKEYFDGIIYKYGNVSN